MLLFHCFQDRSCRSTSIYGPVPCAVWVQGNHIDIDPWRISVSHWCDKSDSTCLIKWASLKNRISGQVTVAWPLHHWWHMYFCSLRRREKISHPSDWCFQSSGWTQTHTYDLRSEGQPPCLSEVYLSFAKPRKRRHWDWRRFACSAAPFSQLM